VRRYPGACPRMTAAAEATHLPNEWHQGELYPRVGFIVTNLNRPPERVVKFYNGRGTAEQWIREGKNALRCTRLSCHAFRHNAVRLQLHALT
jgi:Transposase DDE domain group 1